jgi:hypothetical protein
MTRTTFVAAALALAVTLPAMPAQATGAARTFVSAAGGDSNNCTNVATPCRHLATGPSKSAPVIIGGRNGRKLNCYNMACGNQSIRIMGVLGTAGFQCLQFALHGMD